MGQSILNQGDLVRYHIRNETLDSIGFVLGQFYEVAGQDSHLNVKTGVNDNFIYLVDGVNQLTEYADYFAKHRCPIVLPLGLLQKRLNG